MRRRRPAADARALDHLDRRYAEVARAMRDAVIEHYRERGEQIDTPAGRRTLDTNSVLAARRGRLLLEMLGRAGGPTDLRGHRVIDLGCGFGSLALYFALAGARVTAIDPYVERARVGGAVAQRLGLPVEAARGWMDDLTFPDAAFDLAVLNNALCYVADRRDRRAALTQIARVLEPGGWLLMRNPSRTALLDPFTGRPFLHQLPPGLARRLARRSDPPRSVTRTRTGGGQARELRLRGFREVRRHRIDEPWWRPPRYIHHTARRPPV